MSSCRNSRVFAALDILPLSKAQCPWPLPYPWRYLLAYVLFSIPALPGRNKHWCGLWDFPLSNQKNVFTRLFIVPDHIRFTAGSFHFIERPEFLGIGFQL